MITLEDFLLLVDTDVYIMDEKVALPMIVISKSQFPHASEYFLINFLQKEVVKIDVYPQFGLCIWLKQED